MKLRVSLVLGLVAALLALAGPAVTAQAYPVTTCPTLAISTTTPRPGEAVAVSGTMFTPGASVRLELHSKTYVLGRVTVSPDGTFSTSVTMPASVTGNHDIVAVGGGSGPGTNCPVDPVQILAGGGSSSGSTGTNGGGTAFTGVDVLWLLLVAAGLVGIGVLLTRGGKRRAGYRGEI